MPGPRLDGSFALVRDRRGIQLVNLQAATSHQLMLSAVPVQYTDIDFLQLQYDQKTHKTHVTTLFYGAYPKNIKEELDMSA